MTIFGIYPVEKFEESFNAVQCSECGEMVVTGYAQELDGKFYCRPCLGAHVHRRGQGEAMMVFFATVLIFVVSALFAMLGLCGGMLHVPTRTLCIFRSITQAHPIESVLYHSNVERVQLDHT